MSPDGAAFRRALGLGEEERLPAQLRLPGVEHVREHYFRLLALGVPMVEPLAAGGQRAAFACRGPEGEILRVVWEGERSF